MLRLRGVGWVLGRELFHAGVALEQRTAGAANADVPGRDKSVIKTFFMMGTSVDVESERDVGVGLRYAARVKLIVNDASKAAESAESYFCALPSCAFAARCPVLTSDSTLPGATAEEDHRPPQGENAKSKTRNRSLLAISTRNALSWTVFGVYSVMTLQFLTCECHGTRKESTPRRVCHHQAEKQALKDDGFAPKVQEAMVEEEAEDEAKADNEEIDDSRWMEGPDFEREEIAAAEREAAEKAAAEGGGELVEEEAGAAGEGDGLVEASADE
eukprot:946911-Rhodomonas_salina.3